MPRGVPKAGFRNRDGYKAASKPAYQPTGRPRGRPRKNPLPDGASTIVTPVKPKEATVNIPLKEMNVKTFIEKAELAAKELRDAANETNHVKEAEMLVNFAIVIERQMLPKYKKPFTVD